MARRERRAYRVVCKERATTPSGLRAAARRGAAAGGHLLRCRSSTMSPHRLRRGVLHLPARRSRRSASLIPSQALNPRLYLKFICKGSLLVWVNNFPERRNCQVLLNRNRGNHSRDRERGSAMHPVQQKAAALQAFAAVRHP